jgi:hypothetical protein
LNQLNVNSKIRNNNKVKLGYGYEMFSATIRLRGVPRSTHVSATRQLLIFIPCLIEIYQRTADSNSNHKCSESPLYLHRCFPHTLGCFGRRYRPGISSIPFHFSHRPTIFCIISLSLSRFGTISFFLFLSLVLPLWSVYTVLLDDTAVFVIVSSTLVLQCIDCSAVQ